MGLKPRAVVVIDIESGGYVCERSAIHHYDSGFADWECRCRGSADFCCIFTVIL